MARASCALSVQTAVPLKPCLSRAILATTSSASCSSFTNHHNDESGNADYRELCGVYVAEEFPIVETSLTQPNRDLSETWPGNYSIRFNSERSAVALIDQFQGCLALFESDNAVIRQVDLLRVSAVVLGERPVYLPSRRYSEVSGQLAITCQSALNQSRQPTEVIARISPNALAELIERASRGGDPVCELAVDADSIFVGLQIKERTVVWEAASGIFITERGF